MFLHLVELHYTLVLVMAQNFKHIVSWMLRSLRARVIVLSTVLLFIVYHGYNLTLPVRYAFSNENIHIKCIIPDLDPYDKSIMQYLWDPDPIVCDSNPDLFYFDEMQFLHLNTTAKDLLKIKDIECSYKSVVRNSDDRHVSLSEEKPFQPPVYIGSEMFTVTCQDADDGHRIYERLLAHIDQRRVHHERSIKNGSPSRYNVHIFGIDSVSRLSAERKLPITLSYLRKHLDAYVFKGYMKVGDNTEPNIIAALTGRKAFSSELNNIKGRLENYPFIWKNFSAAGYATMMAEEAPDMTMFKTLSGFEKEPVDHYFKPFWMSMWNVNPVQYVLDPFIMQFEDKKMGIQKTSSMCYGNTPKHMLQIQYFKQFIQAYREHSRFAFSWLVELCHTYQNFCANGDKDFAQFFKWMHDDGYLENTILIFMSDHGSRIDVLRNTYVGRIEERMPVFALYVPPNLKKRFPHLHQILSENTKRLTTHYDLYETLKDVLNSNFQFRNNNYSNNNVPRGISLFSAIPEDRSCAQAGIPEHYCACYGSSPANITSVAVQNIADYMVQHLNKVLEPVADKCETLSLGKIKHANHVTLGLKHVPEEDPFSLFGLFGQDNGPEREQKRYLVLVEVEPSKGLFEATVAHRGKSDMLLLGDISRTNRYGKQSACVEDRLHRQYCFCKNYTPEQQ